MSLELLGIAELVRRESGIVIDSTHDARLRAAIAEVLPGSGGAFERLSDPVAGPAHLLRLVDRLTTNETFFFRDRDQLDAIDWHALVRQAREAGRGVVRVWSAGCATGEEPYTLALLALEAFAPSTPPVAFLGTDVAERVLGLARAGRYRARAVRTVPQRLRERYFHVDGGELLVGERLRELVAFRRHNLVRDPAPPQGETLFDLVVCRNTLIYFDRETCEGVAAALRSALRPDGRLVLGAADALTVTAPVAAPAPRRPLGVEVAGGRTGGAADSTARACLEAGLAELEAGEAHRAIVTFRRALFLEPTLGLAAFALGRAHDAGGEPEAARRAYEQALRTLAADGETLDPLFGQIDLGDVAAACRTRILALGGTEPHRL